uniref:Uncharacterized protein n=1 Tax=Arundo donax TaxID=35708 RepID=A0A0A9FY74_ARUDO
MCCCPDKISATVTYVCCTMAYSSGKVVLAKQMHILQSVLMYPSSIRVAGYCLPSQIENQLVISLGWMPLIQH